MTVWRFRLGSVAHMPRGARIVHVGTPEGVLTLWAEVDPDAEKTLRTFEVFGTGQHIPDHCVHLHTWIEGPYVWHLYEVPA